MTTAVHRLHTHEPRVSEGAATWLAETGASVVVAGAGQLWLITAGPDGRSLARQISLDEVGGLAVDGRRLLAATGWQVWSFVATPDPEGGTAPVFLPQAAHTTGWIGATDLAVTPSGPVVVSGLFSCLAALDDHHSMRPVWAPPGLTALLPETRWLLSGVAVGRGGAAFVTAGGRSEEPGGWALAPEGAGLLLATDGTEVLGGLTVPRHPRLYDGNVLVIDGGSGRLLAVDGRQGTAETITTVVGVPGALAVSGRVALVAHGDAAWAAAEGLTGGPAGRPVLDTVTLIDLGTGSAFGTIEFLGRAGPLNALAVVTGSAGGVLAAPRGILAQSTVAEGDPVPLGSS